MSDAYSAKVLQRRRSAGKRYELVSCAFQGHALVGLDAEHVEPSDATFVREAAGTRWYRCLRCDAWIPLAPPASPTRPHVPSRDEVVLPARGPALRDKYVLRLIAVERGIHVLVFGSLAAIIFTFARHDASLHRAYVNIMNDLSGGNPGESQVRGFLGYLGRAFRYSPRRLVELGLALTAYAGLEACEMVGLWLNKRWAEYLTFVATTALVPFEIYELTISVSVFKILTLAVNLAIVVYLLLAKRLFGLRGGHRAEMERRRALSGWPAVEAATPDVAVPVGTL